MGSFIELNAILQITSEQGFPVDVLDLKKHQQNPITAEDLKETLFSFHSKPNPRVYLFDPMSVLLVQNIDGKWLFWGKAQIQSQAINKKLDLEGNWKEGEWETYGTYTISDIYEPDYQRIYTIREAIPGKSFF